MYENLFQVCAGSWRNFLSQAKISWSQAPSAPSLKELQRSVKNLTKEQAALLKHRWHRQSLQTTGKISFPLQMNLPSITKVTKAPLTLQDPTPETGAAFGRAVLLADLNGDDQADAVVGASNAVVNGDEAGQVFVYFGPAYSAAPLIIGLPTPNRFASFGAVLATGDLNKDGVNDLIVGAPASDAGGDNQAGEVFVFLGGKTFDPTVDFTLREPSPESHSEFGVSLAAGDINGDGSDDLVVGAEASEVPGTSGDGQAFVFLGGLQFDAAPDFTLQAPVPESFADFGRAVATNDLNGDGAKDVIITSPRSDVGSFSEAGKAFVFLGGPSFDMIADFTLQDPNPQSQLEFGFSMASGDMNGDHIDDLALISYRAEGVRIYFGAAPFNISVDATLLNPTPNEGFAPILACGDFNKDGFYDVVMGIPGLSLYNFRGVGQAYIFYGGLQFDTSVDVTLQDPNPEFQARFGGAVSFSPKGDLIVGAAGSSIFTPGQRDFYDGTTVRFNLSPSGDAIEPFGLSFLGFNGRFTRSEIWTTTYPLLPIVNNRVEYIRSSDNLRATFITPDFLEGTVSSNRFIAGELFQSDPEYLFAKRGGFAGEAFVFSTDPPPPGPAKMSIIPSSFQFTAIQGVNNPTAQVLKINHIGGSGSTLNWTATMDAPWLTVSPVSGSVLTDSTKNVMVQPNIQGLAVGTYEAKITISDPNATNSPQTASVKLVVQPKPTISFTPASFQFTAVHGGTNPASQILRIGNTGGGPLNYILSDNAPWLTLSRNSGALQPQVSQEVELTVSTANLAIGDYEATITIADPNATNNPQTVTVKLTVTPKPTITLSHTSFQYTAIQGGGNPPGQTLIISNTGGGILRYGLDDDAFWLSSTRVAGALSPGATHEVMVYASISGLSVGTYNATITVDDANATNSPQTVSVQLIVRSSQTKPTITLSATSYQITATQGAGDPPAQNLRISNTGGGTLNFTLSGGTAWLTLNPERGAVLSGENQDIKLMLVIANLTVGTYKATLTITDSSATNNPQNVSVQLLVRSSQTKPTISLNPTTFDVTATQGGNEPSAPALIISNTGGGTLNYNVDDNALWLSLTRAFGSLASGESHEARLSFSVRNLVAGTHNATITISDPNATNLLQTAAVRLTILPPTAVEDKASTQLPADFVLYQNYTR